MGLRDLQPGESIGAGRLTPVVCIPVFGASELFAQCLRSVLSHTPLDVPVLVADDASPDDAMRPMLAELAATGALEHDVIYVRQPANVGLVRNLNDALRSASPGDAILLNSDCMVADGWLDGLRRAAYSDDTVATASALTNHGTILSVPERNHPVERFPQDWSFELVARRIREASPRLYPRIPTAVGHCMYVRRCALELVGDLDEAFSPGYGEEVDFSQRCILNGLSHVAADDVFVLHSPGSSFGSDNPLREEHERLLAARYPHYHPTVAAAEEDVSSPLARSLSAARRAIVGLSVTIDGRCLGPIHTGTQIQTLEVIHAIWSTGEARVRVILPPDAGRYAKRALASIPEVEVATVREIERGTYKSDIVHRPYQVTSADDLELLDRAGERLVISHQDLIAFHNPGYFPSYESWLAYRRLSRQALSLADMVVFLTRHAANDAIVNDLAEPGVARVVNPGADHRLMTLHPEPRPPAALSGLDTAYLLCLGTDYRHKNRLFALRLFAALRGSQGWDGRLVLAGPRVDTGSSAGPEATLLMADRDLARATVELPAVSEAEKSWLVNHAQAVLYPTVSEGFGLVPFEAAAAGVPCVFAPQTSLAEVLAADTAAIIPWDPEATAERVAPLLRAGEERNAVVEATREAGRRFKWDDTGRGLVQVYREALDRPYREARSLAREGVGYSQLFSSLGEDGFRLVGPDGYLPPEVMRALLAISTRRTLRIPAFSLLRGIYRTGYRARHRGSSVPASGNSRPPELD